MDIFFKEPCEMASVSKVSSSKPTQRVPIAFKGFKPKKKEVPSPVTLGLASVSTVSTGKTHPKKRVPTPSPVTVGLGAEMLSANL